MRVKLEDVCERGSSNLKQSDIIAATGDYPIYGASGYIGNVDFYHQDKPYVAVVKDGAGIGRTTLLPAKSSVIGTMQYLLPKENVLPEYLCYVVRYMHLEKYFTGATIPHIYFKDYKNEQFNLDSLERQAEIVDILGKCERVIASREDELQKLDELIKARFVELFGNIKTNEFGWERCTFKDVSTKITDGEHGTVPRVNEDEGFLYFMARNITKDGEIDLSETSFVPKEIHEKIYKRCNPEKNDLLLVCVGATIGKCALVPEAMKAFSMARSVALIKPNKDKVTSTFLINLLRSEEIQKDIDQCSHAAAQAGLYTNMINNLDAFVPPMKLQMEFGAFCKQVDKSKSVVQKSLDEAQLLFDSLMQKYFG